MAEKGSGMEETGSLCGLPEAWAGEEPVGTSASGWLQRCAWRFLCFPDSSGFGKQGRADPERNGMFSGMEQP